VEENSNIVMVELVSSDEADLISEEIAKNGGA